MLRHAATRKEYAAAFTFACHDMLKFTKLLDHQPDRNFEKSPFNNDNSFKVIPIEKVPYTSLVLGKNNKLEPKEQNFGD